MRLSVVMDCDLVVVWSTRGPALESNSLGLLRSGGVSSRVVCPALMPNASDNARVATAGEARRRNVNGAMANEAIGTSYPRQDRRESSVVAAFGAISRKREKLTFERPGFSPRGDCERSHRLAG